MRTRARGLERIHVRPAVGTLPLQSLLRLEPRTPQRRRRLYRLALSLLLLAVSGASCAVIRSEAYARVVMARKSGCNPRLERPSCMLTTRRADWRSHFETTLPRTWTWRELAHHHLTGLAAKDSPSLADWKSFHQRIIEDFDALPLTDHTVDHWRAWLKARELDRPKLAQKTLVKYLGLASASYEYAREHGACGRNPIAELPRKARPRRQPRRPLHSAQSVLSPDELRRVLAVDGFQGDFFDHLWFSACVFLGGRYGEAAGANVGDYRARLAPLAGVVVERQWHTKTRKLRALKDGVPRAVPVHPALARLLELAPHRFAARVGRLPTEADPLFPFFPERFSQGAEPRRWNQRTALRRLHEFCARLEIPEPVSGRRTLHCTRHTFISRLHCAGADDLAIRALTHPATALRRSGDAHTAYTHLDWSALCAAVLLLEVPGPGTHAGPDSQMGFRFIEGEEA